MLGTGIMALADKLGVIGEDGWLTEKLPAMYHSYDNAVDPTVDFGKKLVNIGGEFLDLGKSGVEAAGDLIYDTTKWGPGGESPQGIGSLKTTMMDAVGPWIGEPQGSGMDKEAGILAQSYAPPKEVAGWLDPNKKEYTAEDFEVNLENWDVYQNWKKGSGWDSADDRRVNKKVESRLEKDDFSADFLWDSFLDMSKQPGYEHITESTESINHWFPQYVKMEKDYARNKYQQFFEFEETGNDYAKWASQKYQNTLLSKYGKYPVFEDIDVMSQNFSPFLGDEGKQLLNSTFNLANEDYINALNKGESGMKPTEWDYGLFDDDASIGITKPHEPWFDYSTKEAEEFYEAPQALIPELLVGGTGFLKAPKLLKYVQKPLQNTIYGRYAREFAPGLFQWGKRDNFGFPKFEKNEGWRKFYNKSTGVIDWARPKGLQFGAAAAASEVMDRD